jgi:hypothetical protein
MDRHDHRHLALPLQAPAQEAREGDADHRWEVKAQTVDAHSPPRASAVKNYPINFSPRPDGSFVLLSANIGGDVVDIRGRVAAGVRVTSAQCEHHWHLKRTEP